MGCCMKQGPPPMPQTNQTENADFHTVTLKPASPRKFAAKVERLNTASFGGEEDEPSIPEKKYNDQHPIDIQLPDVKKEQEQEQDQEEQQVEVLQTATNIIMASPSISNGSLHGLKMETQESELQTRMDSLESFVQTPPDQPVEVPEQQIGKFKRLYTVFEEYVTNEDGTKMDIYGLTKALSVFGMTIDTDRDFQRHIFRKFDVDNEKEITYDDFSATIASFVGSNTDDDSLQTLFEIFDIDQDGYLELEDMAKVLLAQNQMAVVVTGQQSGKIQRYTKEQCLKLARRLKAQHDSEEFHNNKICFDRFKAMMDSRTENDMMQTPSISNNDTSEYGTIISN